MVGGKVIQIIAAGDRVWVNVEDTQSKRRKPEQCAIYIEPTADAVLIRPGDSLWWQGGWAMWTPANRKDRRVDVRIQRIGYSGVKKPRVGNA